MKYKKGGSYSNYSNYNNNNNDNITYKSSKRSKRLKRLKESKRTSKKKYIKQILVGIDYGGIFHIDDDLQEMDTTPQYDIWLDSEWWEIYDVLDSITNESIKKKLKKIILEIITFNSLFVTLVCIIFKKNKFDNIFFEDIWRRDRSEKKNLQKILDNFKHPNIIDIKKQYDILLTIYDDFNIFIKILDDFKLQKQILINIGKFNKKLDNLKSDLYKLNINFIPSDGSINIEQERFNRSTERSKLTLLRCGKGDGRKTKKINRDKSNASCYKCDDITKCNYIKKEEKIKTEITEDSGYLEDPENTDDEDTDDESLEREIKMIELINKIPINQRPKMVAAEVYFKTNEVSKYGKNTFIKKSSDTSDTKLIMMRKIEYEFIELLNDPILNIDINLIKSQLLDLTFGLFKNNIYFTDLKPDNLMITYNKDNLNNKLLPGKIHI